MALKIRNHLIIDRNRSHSLDSLLRSTPKRMPSAHHIFSWPCWQAFLSCRSRPARSTETFLHGTRCARGNARTRTAIRRVSRHNKCPWTAKSRGYTPMDGWKMTCCTWRSHTKYHPTGHETLPASPHFSNSLASAWKKSTISLLANCGASRIQ